MRATVLAACVLTVLPARADVFDHPTTADALLAGPLATAAAQIAGAKAIRGRFVFRRYLADIPKPLVSNGEYVVLQGVGIDWHTLQPFDSESIVTGNGVTQIDEGAAHSADVDAPAMRAVIRMLSALLSLDVAALASTFELFGDAAVDGRWQIGLRPRAQDLATFIRDATIAGAAQIDTVSLRDANGDRTEIEFHEVRYDTASPSPAERARFGE
jgi:hypothetical protein